MPLDPTVDPVATAGLETWSPDPAAAPAPDPAAEPEGFVVLADGDVRLHFLDWGGPAAGTTELGRSAAGTPTVPRAAAAAVLLLPGLLGPAWTWAPVARRLSGSRHAVVADLRGQGLSDSPMHGYDPVTLAADAVAVAEGAGLLDGDAPIVLAGHGFGGIVAVGAAARLGIRCAGLVLVDGGFERHDVTTAVDVDEFLRGLDEPPEILRSMAAYLADRRGFDPATWDADQERASLDGVVETAAGHVVRAVRPFVVESIVRTMFAYEPAPVLAAVDAPVTALVALGAGDAEARLAELRRCGEARLAAGRSPIRATGFPDAHNLMRYRPAEVTDAILRAAG
jgi:pimeloyl-ACP methyl ester carboxylesterase